MFNCCYSQTIVKMIQNKQRFLLYKLKEIDQMNNNKKVQINNTILGKSDFLVINLGPITFQRFGRESDIF